jgi:hypothetical protein
MGLPISWWVPGPEQRGGTHHEVGEPIPVGSRPRTTAGTHHEVGEPIAWEGPSSRPVAEPVGWVYLSRGGFPAQNNGGEPTTR